MIPGMIVCSAVQERPSDWGARRAESAYFIDVAQRFAKLQIYRQGEEAVVFALLSLAQRVAEPQPSTTPVVAPTTPSAMIPPYLKPKVDGRRKRPGRKTGHPGSRRPTPEVIDRHADHRLPSCPECHGPLTRTNQARTRITEDIPEAIIPVVTGHTIHRDWCPHCRKAVEPVVTDALPDATPGNRTPVLSAWLHYGLGNTLSRIVAVFNHHLTLKVTPGGLIQMWYRLQAILFAWYLEIQAQALDSAVLHADETGWPVDGTTHWPWCFTTTDLTYSMIDRGRGSPALAEFFKDEFAGPLVTDFRGAYNAVVRAQAEMPGAPATRVEDGGQVRSSWAELARVRQEVAAPAGRRDPAQETRGGTRRGICLATCTLDDPAR
jgi:transposase